MIETQAAGKPTWEMLGREYPDHLECYYCRDMHAVDKVNEYASGWAKSKSCWKLNHKVRTAKFIHPKFSFTVFRMIMKRHRQGTDCDKLLELLAYRSGAVREGAQVKQVVTVPKIVNGRLSMRIETVYVILSKERSELYLLNRNLVECPHASKWTLDNRTVTRRLFQRLAALQTIPCDRQEFVMSCQCRFCPTEFEFNLQRFEGQGAVLFITKWQDLGNGLSPLHSELSSVVGPRRMIRMAEKGDQPSCPSPRATSENHAPGGDFQAVSTIGYKERKDLFVKISTMLAGLNRINDSFCWGFWSKVGVDHPYEKDLKPGEKTFAIDHA
jgi:hypothetical protein